MLGPPVKIHGDGTRRGRGESRLLNNDELVEEAASLRFV
jgi:hypothetical protein